MTMEGAADQSFKNEGMYGFKNLGLNVKYILERFFEQWWSQATMYTIGKVYTYII